jgi:ribosome recycling factor
MIEEHKVDFDKVVERCTEELKQIRAAKATPALLDGIVVEAYGTMTPVNQLGNVNVTDPKTMVIQAWDQSVLPAIENAIRNSDLGLNPVNEGDIIRLVIPPLTEERRRDLVKTLGRKIEDFRIAVRQVRDKVKDEVIKAEKAGDISEDDKFRFLEKLDKLTGETNDRLKELADKKEADIMTV